MITPAPIARKPAATINTSNVWEEGAGGPPPSGTTLAGAGVGAGVRGGAGALVGTAVGALVGATVAPALAEGLVPWQLTSWTVAPVLSTMRTKSVGSPSRKMNPPGQTNVPLADGPLSTNTVTPAASTPTGVRSKLSVATGSLFNDQPVKS